MNTIKAQAKTKGKHRKKIFRMGRLGMENDYRSHKSKLPKHGEPWGL
jgi:hypothetical protein